jgi:hypothetical protein
MESAKQFGEFMRDQRRAKNLGLDDIAHTTRIPQRSLRYLEAGDFDMLPADVFVRGFIRAYAAMIGIDAEEAVRRYAACGKAPAPVSLVSAEEVARAGAGFVGAAVPGTVLPDAAAHAPTAPPSEPALASTVAPKESDAGSFIPDMLRGGQPSRRGPITLAVIILVIVATLTMSYLLQRPSSSGDGITRSPLVDSAPRG